MLKSLKLHGVGPVEDLSARFGERLNVFTGDNGLGKSFLLDVCFWVLTGSWPGGRMAMPDPDSRAPRISYELQSKTKSVSREMKYEFKLQSWPRPRGRPPMAGLVVYAAVDGSFAVWDPARNYYVGPGKKTEDLPRAFQFSPASPLYDSPDGDRGQRVVPRDVANGLFEHGIYLCQGLIADWVEWYYRKTTPGATSPFSLLEEALRVLSHPLEPLRCDEPRRVSADDSRTYPALRMPYGVVPYPQWSAGVKRIVSIAYLLVWAWVEHKRAVEFRKEQPTDRIILLVDEIEAHLHPKWQRVILPALLNVVAGLQASIAVEVMAATHSPLVLASLEPTFDEDADRLFWFDLQHGEVAFREYSWAIHGDVSNWLTSPIFGLGDARSREAEEVIERAEKFMEQDSSIGQRYKDQRTSIEHEMRRVLPGDDPIWSRWLLKTKGKLPL